MASVAQLAEQLICNQPVVGSNPSAGSGIENITIDWMRMWRQLGSLATTTNNFWGFARVVKGGGL